MAKVISVQISALCLSIVFPGSSGSVLSFMNIQCTWILFLN